MPSASTTVPATIAAGTVAAIGLVLVISAVPSAYAANETPPATTTPSPSPTPTPAPTPSPTPPISTWPSSVYVGKSVRGRSIYAIRQGNPNATKILLAVGIIHGNEKAGQRIVDAVRKVPVSATGDVQIWTIQSMNPDGTASTKRRNARSVDLNRNFPTGWSRKTAGAGSAPASEPETQSLVRFMTLLRPDATLVYHQDWNMVLGTCNMKTRPYALRYAKLTGLRKEACGRASYTGTMGSWYNSNFPGYLLTVELPGSRKVTAKKVTKWRDSVLTTSRELLDIDPPPVTPPPVTPPSETPAPEPSPDTTSS